VRVGSLDRLAGLRTVPWLTWVLLALAAAYLVYRWGQPGFAALDAFVGCAPLVFGAAVIYARPADRRFAWAALAIAAGPVLRLAAILLPGAWVAVVPVLLDVAQVGLELVNVLLLVGLAVLAYALGGLRSAFGVTVVLFGGVVALADLTWVFARPVQDMPLADLVKSIAFATLTALAWAFLLAAAIDALRSLLLSGAGLLFANVVIRAVLLWMSPGLGPDTNFDLLALVVNGIALAGWVLLIAAALSGELSSAKATAVRSRADRRSAARPRAG
jgi:hypothetical protein